MFQTLAPFLKTLPIFEPALPYMAERPTVGKKLATATPTSALALIMFCSAWRMSGRRRRRSGVSPSGVAACDSAPSVIHDSVGPSLEAASSAAASLLWV